MPLMVRGFVNSVKGSFLCLTLIVQRRQRKLILALIIIVLFAGLALDALSFSCHNPTMIYTETAGENEINEMV